MSTIEITIPVRDVEAEDRLLEQWGLGDEVAMWWVEESRKWWRLFRSVRKLHGRTVFCKRSELPAFPGERRTFRVYHHVTYFASLDGWEVEAPGTFLDGWSGPWDEHVMIHVKPGDTISFTFRVAVE